MLSQIILKPLGQTFGYTVGTTVSSLPPIPSGALQATIQIETQPLRVTFDGLTTSVTVGVGLYMGTIGEGREYIVEGWDNLNRMRMRCDGSTAGTINVVYEGEGQPT
jgi:hypothetical protein